MGQQQLLLIILGVIVVGIAVAVGITMFSDNAVSANRDAVSNDLVNLAARAQQYYRRPEALGGGGNKFTGLTMAKMTNMAGAASGTATNANGQYSISGTVAADNLTIQGLGTERVGTTPVTMCILVRDQGRTDSLYQVN